MYEICEAVDHSKKNILIWFIDFKYKTCAYHGVWKGFLDHAHFMKNPYVRGKRKIISNSGIPRIFYLWWAFSTEKQSRPVSKLAECAPRNKQNFNFFENKYGFLSFLHRCFFFRSVIYNMCIFQKNTDAFWKFGIYFFYLNNVKAIFKMKLLE